jgi:hypothetical protein
MSIETLREKFIVDSATIKAKLEDLITKALVFCVVGEDGVVHITSPKLNAKQKVKLVLSARMLASQLTPNIAAETGVADLVKSTGIDENQLRARTNEIVKERFANSPARGVFRANAHKIEEFLDSLQAKG